MTEHTFDQGNAHGAGGGGLKGTSDRIEIIGNAPDHTIIEQWAYRAEAHAGAPWRQTRLTGRSR